MEILPAFYPMPHFLGGEVIDLFRELDGWIEVSNVDNTLRNILRPLKKIREEFDLTDAEESEDYGLRHEFNACLERMNNNERVKYALRDLCCSHPVNWENIMEIHGEAVPVWYIFIKYSGSDCRVEEILEIEGVIPLVEYLDPEEVYLVDLEDTCGIYTLRSSLIGHRNNSDRPTVNHVIKEYALSMEGGDHEAFIMPIEMYQELRERFIEGMEQIGYPPIEFDPDLQDPEEQSKKLYNLLEGFADESNDLPGDTRAHRLLN